MKILSVVLSLAIITTLTACTKSEMQEASSSAVQVIKNTTDTVKETHSDMMDEAKDMGGDMMEGTGDLMDEAADKMGELKDAAEEVAESLSAATYVKYDADKGMGQKHILFFYADWCPTCVKWEGTLTESLGSLPSNTLIMKVDYDTADDLKTQYKITKQSTAVFINADGSVAKTEADPSMESVTAFFSS